MEDNINVSTSHVQVSFIGAHNHYLEDGGAVRPSVTIGLQGDGRNEDSFLGFGVGSEVGYETFNSLKISGSGRSMLSGLNQVYSKQLEGSLNFDIDHDGIGVLFSMSPSWSETDTDSTRYVWNSAFLDDSNDNIAYSDGISFSSEIGYGFEILDGSTLTTPYSAFEQRIDNGRKFEIGSRISTESGIKFEFEAIRNISGSGKVGHEYNMNGNVN